MKRLLFLSLLAVAMAFSQSFVKPTLGGDIGSSSTVIQLSSTTGISAGNLMYADREAMLVRAVGSGIVTVDRGVEGTAAADHASGATVWIGPQSLFSGGDLTGGGCLSKAASGGQILSIRTGNVWQCGSTGAWAAVSGGPGWTGSLSGGGGGGTWGSITGTLSAQTDLNTALGGKAASNASTTVNGTSCALGSTCTVTAAPNAAINLAASGAGGVTGTLPAANIVANVRARSFGYSFSNSGTSLTTPMVGYFTVPFSCTISAWNIAVDTGTATIDVLKIASGTGVPTSSITGSATPAISTGNALHSTTLTGWTTSVAANDIIGIKLTSVAAATFANLTLECDQ